MFQCLIDGCACVQVICSKGRLRFVLLNTALLLLLLFQNPGFAFAGMSPPVWTVPIQLTSDDGYAFLDWMPAAGETAEFFKITESYKRNISVHYTEARGLWAWRVQPGTYDFVLQACNKNKTGIAQCGRSSEALTLVVSEAVTATLASGAITGAMQADTNSNGGPDQLLPGHWYNPAKDGHGWSFYWSSRFAWSQGDPFFGNHYDLVGIWYTYEAKFSVNEPGCSSCPPETGAYRPVVLMLKAISTGPETYAGSLYMSKSDGSEIWVGSAEVTFASNHDNATINWSANFKKESLSDTDPLVFLHGSNPADTNNISHFSGVWQRNGDEHYFVVESIGETAEVVTVVFHDDVGDPTWIQAVNTGMPVAGSSDFCLAYLLEGYSPQINKPLNWSQAWYLSACDPAQTANSSNRNGRRYFSGLDKEYFWAEFRLPESDFVSGSISIGSSAIVVALEKTASFHGVTYDSTKGSSCELTPAQPICEVLLTWYTDGNYPEATVYAHNYSTNTYFKVLTSTQAAMVNIPYQVPAEGLYDFELRMGIGVETTLMARSEPYTVTEIMPNSPPVLSMPTDQVNAMGDTVELFLHATDPDVDDVLTFSASGLPVELVIDTVSGRISGTLTVAGEHIVLVSVQDNHGGSDSKSLVWEVFSPDSDPEAPPTPAAPPNMAASASSSRVGAAVGEFRVDESGSATYSIPILTAPASGGVVPQVSLVYSSRAGNSELGVGWSLGGISVIALCPQTMEQDGVSGSRGIGLDGADRFCLDGQRLVVDPSSGEYGNNGSHYRTEIDSFARITAYGSAGNGPAWFKVERKDGSVIEYGNSADSRIEARGSQSPATVFAWAQNRFEDRSGNYILYRYLENSYGPVAYVLQSIDYTGNVRAGTQPSARLSFAYKDRYSDSDLTYSYFAGVELEQRHLLQSIRSQGRLQAGSPLEDLRFYELSYDEDGMGRNILTALTECRSASRIICYQPTRFNWLKSASTIDSPVNVLEGLLPKKTLTGLLLADVSGDGRPDLLYTKNKKQSHSLYVKEATASSHFSEWATSYKLPKTADKNAPQVFAIDINSDGLQDVVYSKYTKSTDDYTWVVRVSNGSGFSAETELNSNHRYFLNDPGLASHFRIMDFNGDGLSDILHANTDVSGETWHLTILLNTTAAGGKPGLSAPIELDVENADLFPFEIPGGGELINRPPYFNWGLISADKTDIPDAGIFDFNGDGAVDLLLKVWRNYQVCISNCVLPASVNSSKGGDNLGPVYRYEFISFWVLMESNGQNAFSRSAIVALGEKCTVPEICHAPEYENLPRSKYVWPVDINADGLADLAWGDPGNNWYFQLNTGNGYAAAELIGQVPDGINKLVRFEDWNGDGYPDLIYPSDTLNDNAKWMLYQNHFGRVFAASYNTQLPAGNVGGDSDVDPVENDSSIFADFDGDGKNDHLLINKGKKGNIQSTGIRKGINVSGNRTIEPANVITSITNGLGAVTEITYKPLTNRSVYTRMYDSVAANWGQGASVYDYIAPLFVVSEVSGSSPTYADPEAQSLVEYHYVGAKLQAGGRGLLGFAEIIVYDPQLRIRSNTRYRQDFPFIGLPVDTVRARSASGSKFSPVTVVSSKQPMVWPMVTADTGPPASVSGTLLSYNVKHWRKTTTFTGTWQVYTDNSMLRSYTLSGNLEKKVLTKNRYDTYGNLTRIVVSTIAGDSSVPYSSRTTDNLWSAITESNWNLGRLSNSSVTHTRSGKSPVIRKSAFEYDDNTGVMSKEIIEPGNTTWEITTSFSYDLFGNRKRTSKKGAGMNPRTQSVNYDSLGRYIISESNALGQVFRKVQMTNRDVFGNPLEIENIDGLVSTTAIDLMGREFASYNETGVWQKTLYYMGAGNECPAGTSWHSISTAGGGAMALQCIDVIGRTIRSVSKGINNQLIYLDQYYDVSGRPSRVSEPYFKNDTRYWNEYVYDPLGRVIGLLSAGGDDISTNYDELAINTCTTAGPGVIVMTNALGQQSSEVKNVLGETIESFDNNCGQVSFNYDPMGNLTSVTGADGTQINMSYDGAGRKIALSDPDKGDWQYAYNALGELTRQLDAKHQAIDFEYDTLGRVINRRELTGVDSLTDTVFTILNHEATVYRGARPGKSQVSTVTYFSGESSAVIHQQSMSYDWLGRVDGVSSIIGDQQFYQHTTYDAYGRIFQQFDASGNDRGLRHVYQYGHLKQLKEAREGLNGVVYQDILEMDARGNVTVAELGNGVITVADYDPANGHLTKLSAYDQLGVELQEVDYLFDVLGNLKSRHDRSASSNFRENFSYDRLNRLEKVQLIAPDVGIPSPIETLTLNYNATGNITWKSDVGTYNYGSGTAGPHAVTMAGSQTYGYDLNGNQLSGAGRSISYTVFDKAVSLTTGNQNTTFIYGIGNGRVKRTDSVAGEVNKTTLYLGMVEYITQADGSTMFKRYLAGVAIATYYPSTSIQQVAYLLKDHIGSIHSVLDEEGLITTRMHFSPFGERQDVNWQTALDSFLYAPLNGITTRGFTGHEHIDSMGIIHMNGRIYDAKLGRFLQADPFIQAAKNTQSLNRYSYVFNNPLSYADPSGFFSFSRFIKKWGRLIVAAIVTYVTYGAASGWAAGWLAGTSLAGNTVAIGMIAGATSGFIGGAIISGSFKGAVQGAFSGALMGGVAGFYGNTYSVNRIATDSLAGGVSAEIYGQKFKDGLMFAFIVSGLTYLNYRMDLAERQNSAQNSDNLNQRGSKLFGNEYSLAGARRTVDPFSEVGSYLPCRSLAGGCQGAPIPGTADQASNLAGIPFNPEGQVGYVVDTFAGPHDWLRNHISRSYIQTPAQPFDVIGNSKYFTGFRKYIDQVGNIALIPVAAPFSAAAFLGTQPSLFITAQNYVYGD